MSPLSGSPSGRSRKTRRESAPAEPVACETGGCSRGSEWRRIQTPMHTSTKAKSVPMLVISPSSSIGKKRRRESDRDSGQGRRNIGRAIFRMYPAERGRQQPVARYRKEDSRLSEHQHQQHGGQSGDGAQRDHSRNRMHPALQECGRERRCDIDHRGRAPCRSRLRRPGYRAACKPTASREFPAAGRDWDRPLLRPPSRPRRTRCTRRI